MYAKDLLKTLKNKEIRFFTEVKYDVFLTIESEGKNFSRNGPKMD